MAINPYTPIDYLFLYAFHTEMHLIKHLTNTRKQTIHTKNPIAVDLFFKDLKIKRKICLTSMISID